MRTKKSVTVTLDTELLKWIDKMVDLKEFGSISHAIDKALIHLRKEYEKKEKVDFT